MRILVIGAGAIGGMMAAKLAMGEGNNEVSVVDMGAHLKAIETNGLKLIWEDGSEIVADNIKAYSKISEAGEQDLVIFALKAQYMASVASELKAVLGDDTMLMTVQNGMPWWYFQKHGGPYDGRRLETLDPDGTLEANTSLVVWSTRRRLWSRMAWSSMSKVIAFRLANWTVLTRPASRRSSTSSLVPDFGLEFSTTFVPKFGSRLGATCRSIQSVRSATRPWKASAFSQKPDCLPST